MSQAIGAGLAVLAMSAAGLTGCGKWQEAPAPAAVAVPTGDTQATSQAAYDAEANKPPTDPVDAFVWRADLCMHLSGEIGGDRSERDVQVQAQMEELNCDDAVVADGRALKAAHASDPAAVAKIDAALKAWADYFGAH